MDSAEFKAAARITPSDSAYRAFGCLKVPPIPVKGKNSIKPAPAAAQRIESSTPSVENAAAESSTAISSFDGPSKVARTVKDPHDNCDFSLHDDDVEMDDEVQHGPSKARDLGGHARGGELSAVHRTGDYDRQPSQPSQDVEMCGLSLEDSARKEARSGQGKAGYLASGRRTVAPLRAQVGRQGEVPSSDDDEMMDDEVADKAEPGKEVKRIAEEESEESEESEEESEESEEESEDSREAAAKMAEDGPPTDTQGARMGGEEEADDEPRRKTRMETLRIRPAATSAKKHGKHVNQPVAAASLPRSKAARATRRLPRQIKSTGTIEAESDADADVTMKDADLEACGGDHPPTASEEDPTGYEEVADGVWIPTMRCTLNSEERPKLPHHLDIDVYGVSPQKIPIRVSVHVCLYILSSCIGGTALTAIYTTGPGYNGEY